MEWGVQEGMGVLEMFTLWVEGSSTVFFFTSFSIAHFSLCLFGRCWYCYYYFAFYIHPEFSSSLNFHLHSTFVLRTFPIFCVLLIFNITPTNPHYFFHYLYKHSIQCQWSLVLQEELYLLLLENTPNHLSSLYLDFILRMKIYQWYL